MTVLDDRPVLGSTAPRPDRPRGAQAWRVFGALAAALGLAFGGLSVVSAVAHRDQTFHRSFSAARLKVIDVSIDDGDVFITGQPGASQVTLRERVSEGLFGTTHSARAVGDRLVVRGHCPLFWSSHCSVQVTATVPADVRLVVHTDNGTNQVTGMTGGTRLTTDNGTIRGRRLAGDLSMSSNNGDIDMASLTSRHVALDTDNGDATLSFRTAPTTLTTHADNGDVTVELPHDSSAYALATSTDNGDVATPIRTDPASARHISATSDNGDITIRYASTR